MMQSMEKEPSNGASERSTKANTLTIREKAQE